MRFGPSVIFSCLAGLSVAAQSYDEDACSQIHSRVANPGNDNPLVTFPGQLALRCLRSMPFESKLAVSFVKEYRKYLQFHSTLETLKNPPSGYQMPPTDLMGGLNAIQEKAAANHYKNQYEFDSDLQTLVTSAYDGHLSADFCSHSIFTFRNEPPLVSISTNGIDLPKIYTTEDARLLSSHPHKVSPVQSINGVDVVKHMKRISIYQKPQDLDALYNTLFHSNAMSIGSTGNSSMFAGYYSSTTRWPGGSQILRFANGSKTDSETIVHLREFPWQNTTALYENFCVANKDSSSSQSGSEAHPLPLPDGYPEPFVRDNFNRIMGFFPEHSGLKDIAVLSVPSFQVQGATSDGKLPDTEIVDFSNTARDFLANATDKGKKKMIVDLSGNPGGSVLAGDNLFRMFFPDKVPYSAGRFRAHDAVNLLGKVASPIVQRPDSILKGFPPFDWTSMVQPDQKKGFKSWKDLYSPRNISGVESSSLFATNFSRVSEHEVPINGYGNVMLNPSKAAFEPEDIIMITDGYCASTCTVFAELMKEQGVRTIAFGGRPQFAPMQGLGGTKGAQVLQFSQIASILPMAKSLAKQTLNKEEYKKWERVVPIPLKDFPLTLYSGGVNLLSAFSSKNDKVPRQFVYEAAECRRFFTAENIDKPVSIWSAAADSMFHGGPCVPFSTNGTGSLHPEEKSTNEKLISLFLEFLSGFKAHIV
ncbi:hypothetical protein NUU61_001812 [Penicillium alfredii]|uniref:Tail specific protease domain-containing protein n=1 Tax=Penicillium alfredii TaxID=1506179 RepID=A0A9W9FR12_9EURO|nr:uncharacterized protein NUU61_001812 [Penicillium alfredii]KAJ5104465.1 hypothetical protein NUU61_001812 [Penicillium alfredii]